ncbi:FAD-binding protein [Nostocoides sp. F2B08]|uniref:NAD(P)/FAD-dependent oxidoreductase n=1 Tax=Nostocoides sp. F2B08 TaxID=2653936 RepID=UPI001262E6CA|nr:FAD-dependent oxidoreductase [Tetrasphaera sp. F2B08]KAB7741011.1 FAD-binding protein [Tetrasphaera sp. F2B08]
MDRSHDVVIVGGGNAGISLAARLRRLGLDDVAIVAPGPVHRYRPLLNYVAGGQADLDRLTKPQREVIPDGCVWIQDRAAAVDESRNQVELEGGERVGYADLVLAPGLEHDLHAILGLEASMHDGWSTTAHLSATAESTWTAIQRTRRGKVVFTIPPEPAPCGGTALKPLFMACDHWRREGVLPDIDVHLVSPYSEILDVPSVENHLRRGVERFDVTVRHRATVATMDPATRTITLDSNGVDEIISDVEQAFVVPHYRAPRWLAPLAGDQSAGLVDVDPRTLRHRRLDRVWSLGDAAAVDTRPSGGALRRQVDVLADNIRRSRSGETLREYDGYTIIPITLDRRRLLLAEFDRDGNPQPTVSFVDLTAPRRVLWAFDRYLEPIVYYRGLLKGRV